MSRGGYGLAKSLDIEIAGLAKAGDRNTTGFDAGDVGQHDAAPEMW